MQKTLIEETKRKEKHNKGITLIALVVTIIILLILAGVSIITLTGENGIITRTSGAKTAIENASIREQVQLAVMAGMSNRDLRVEQEMLEDALTKSFGAKGTGYTIEGNSTDGWTVTVGELSYKVTSTGGMEEVQQPVDIATVINTTVNKTTAVKDASETPQVFYIPENYKLVSDAETTVDDGIVVEDGSGNQFVWVPVPNPIGTSESDGASKKSMAIKLDDGNYRGLLYDFTGSSSKIMSGCTTTTDGYREPALLSSHDNENTAQSVEDLNDEYNKMVESVDKYKGFYVGRYETGYETITNESNTEIKITSKKASSPVTTLDASQQVKVGDTVVINNKWYGLYKAQKEFATSGKVRSSMIWGSQYDAMMNWMAKTGKTVGTSTPMEGLARNTLQTTGSNSADIINNVFDLYGCHLEWTLEADRTYNRAERGDNFRDSCAPASRGSSDPVNTYNSYGSRLTLYIVD